MPCTWEAGHVGSNLSQEDFSQTPLDAWDRLQPPEQTLIGAQAFGNLGTHAFDSFIQYIDVSELFAQEEAVVRLEQPLEGLLQQIAFGTHPATSELG